MIISFLHFLLLFAPHKLEMNTAIEWMETDDRELTTANDLKFLACGDSSLSQALNLGLGGFEYYNKEHALNDYLIVIDFTKASSQQRLFVFDVQKEELIHPISKTVMVLFNELKYKLGQ